MRVEVHGVVRLAVRVGALVEAQAVGEAGLEEVVVAGGDGLEDGSEGGAFGGGEVGKLPMWRRGRTRVSKGQTAQ